MKTFNIKNLFVGTLENEAVVTLNVKQVEENGVYSLEASYCRCYIESEKIYDLLYYDNNCLRMKRKFDKFTQILKK